MASLNNEGRQDHDVMLEQLSRNESQSAAKVASLRAKARYLLHLRSETNNGDTGRICVICQGSFEIGALTVCGHQFCKLYAGILVTFTSDPLQQANSAFDCGGVSIVPVLFARDIYSYMTFMRSRMWHFLEMNVVMLLTAEL